VAFLSVVELLEEVGGDAGVLPDEGVEFMVGRGWGVDGGIGVARHWLAVEGTEGIAAEGGVGLTVLEWGLFLGSMSLRFLWRGCWF